MLANMVSSLFTNGQIQTTLVKAKEARRFAEKLITIGKKGDLHRRRLAVAKLRNKDAVKLLFDEIAPAYKDRNGGYTRILKLGVRRGDLVAEFAHLGKNAFDVAARFLDFRNFFGRGVAPRFHILGGLFESAPFGVPFHQRLQIRHKAFFSQSCLYLFPFGLNKIEIYHFILRFRYSEFL